ncbi:MAG: FAD binding domain-containing protein [Bacillota bacterium]
MFSPFNYYQPESLPEALSLLAALPQPKKILAGGTDIIPALRRGDLFPVNVISLVRLTEMKQINVDNGVVRVGAMTTFTDLTLSPVFLGSHRLVAEAASQVGGPQIRNQGTIGGNIVNASPAGDMLPPLLALGASVRLLREKGERVVSLADFLSGVGSTIITPDEILAEIIFPVLPGNSSSAFVKLGRRNSLAISRISMAAIFVYDPEGRIEEVRLALGAVAPKPVRVPSAEAMLKGQTPGPDLLEEVISEVGNSVAKILGDRPSAPYKRVAVRGVTRQALCGVDSRFR